MNEYAVVVIGRDGIRRAVDYSTYDEAMSALHKYYYNPDSFRENKSLIWEEYVNSEFVGATNTLGWVYICNNEAKPPAD